MRLDGYRCCWRLATGGRCPEPATDVDHIDRGDVHEMWNLQSLCAEHHALKSSQEGNEAQAKKRADARLPPEEPPGVVRAGPTIG